MIFHRIWFGDKLIPLEYQAYWSAWKRQFPDEEFRTWTDLDLSKLNISKNKIDEAKSLASKADIARYEILYKYGGIYIDCDMKPYNWFPAQEFIQELIVCNEDENDNYCSIGFICAPPQHPIFKSILDELINTKLNQKPPNIETGPWLFGKHLRNFNHKKLPKSSFYPYLYNEPQSAILKRNLTNTYGIHIWGGSWLNNHEANQKAIAILKSGDLIDAENILNKINHKPNDLINSIKQIRHNIFDLIEDIPKDLNISQEDISIFNIQNFLFWLFEINKNYSIWQIGACDGILVDPIRPVLINLDPRAALLEPNPYYYELLKKSYGKNSRISIIKKAFSENDGPISFYAVNPNKVDQLKLPQWVNGLSSSFKDRNALGGLTIDAKTRANIWESVEELTVESACFKTLKEEIGFIPDILIVDAEGMDKIVITEIISSGHYPVLIHFEVQCLPEEEANELIGILSENYILLKNGNDITAYNINLFYQYAKTIYINHGITTIFNEKIKIITGILS